MPAHAHSQIDLWSVEGRFQHLIYSPKGAIEGFLIDTAGVPTQYVTEPHDAGMHALLASLRVGQVLIVEGTEVVSADGLGLHTVYHLERIARVDGRAPEQQRARANAHGRVVRFNYARHGEANGVVLDSGDFVHTKPHGLLALGLRVGDQVTAEGEARPLSTGHGRVIEATRVNGQSLEDGSGRASFG